MTKFLFLTLMLFSVISISAQERNVEEDPLKGKNFYESDSTSINLNAGDYLQKAGKKYLYGVGLTLTGSGIIAFSASEGNDNLNPLGGTILIVGAVTTLLGHLDLIKAGKAYNKEQITLKPASRGVGLAINF